MLNGVALRAEGWFDPCLPCFWPSRWPPDLAINDHVDGHKGDLPVVIDKRDYQAQVDAAPAQLGQAPGR
jgi:hypothetical protein